jgi:hypothetical protein
VKESTCDSVWELLSLYADEEASPAECDIVERHVAHCESCALDLQFMRESASVLAQTPLVSPPPELRQAIFAATIYRPTWQERLRLAFDGGLSTPRLQLAGAAGVLLLAGFVIFKSLPQTSGLDNPAPAAPNSGPAVELARTPAARKPTVSTSPPAASLARAHRASNPISELERESLARAGLRDEANAAEVRSNETGSHLSVSTTSARRSPLKPLLGTPQMHRRPAPRGAEESRLAAAPMPKPADVSPLNEPADMREVTGSAGEGTVGIVKNEPAPENKPVTQNSGVEGAARPKRYTLTASLPPGGADGLVTFADLRSTLRKRNDPARTVALDLGHGDRSALWDVYRSRF